MSNLVDHAKAELEAVGQFKEDPAFAQSLVAAVAAFASYGGHSGGSAAVGIQMLNDLLQFKNLSPLTNDPEEWQEVTEGLWQSYRNSAAFSENGGKTYTVLGDTTVYTSDEKRV